MVKHTDLIRMPGTASIVIETDGLTGSSSRLRGKLKSCGEPLWGEDWSRLQEIFDEAWPMDEGLGGDPSSPQRRGSNEELRAEVERMLQAFDEESRATAKPAVTSHGGRFGVWQTAELLGRGGMAEVYLARRVDGQIEQRVWPLKVMSPYLATAEYIQRFRRERQLLARLEHPNIARLLDGGVSQDGAPYMVMEYVDGRRLDEYCDSEGLAIRERLQLMQSLCLAVESAHQNLILHRDIKPSNVLVTATGVVKLLDFGTARELDSGTLETRAPLTPAYASPEQLHGDPVTTQSDGYGLGATLVPADRRRPAIRSGGQDLLFALPQHPGGRAAAAQCVHRDPGERTTGGARGSGQHRSQGDGKESGAPVRIGRAAERGSRTMAGKAAHRGASPDVALSWGAFCDAQPVGRRIGSGSTADTRRSCRGHWLAGAPGA